MLLDRLRIAGKLILLAGIPLLAVVVLAVPILVERGRDAVKATNTAQAAAAADSVGDLVRDLQRERFLSVGYLAGQVDATDVLQQQADAGDDHDGIVDELGEDRSPAITKALAAERKLADLRAAVIAKRASLEQVAVNYQAAILGLIDSLELSDHADATTSVGRQMLALDAVLRSDEYQSANLLTFTQLLVKPSGVLETRLGEQYAMTQEYGNRFLQLATPGQVAIYKLLLDAINARSGGQRSAPAAQYDATLLAGSTTLAAAFPSLRTFTGQGRFVETKLVADITDAASAQRATAVRYAYLIGGAALLVIVLVIFLTVLVARSVARPLIRLTGSAERVAIAAEAELTRVADDESEASEQLRLDAVDMSGRDEVGDLARAFDRVQATAARLVERQAASRRNVATMFGHIGRRTQNLVGRQLAMIDRLEQQESNSDRLRNLYQLDHLSSRLSRNAGSLVVLSGSNAAGEQYEPLPIADVVRLALGEIEDYTRVELEVPEHLTVRPAVVGDLTLVFAELMENATSYSPPHTKVTVSAEGTRAGAQVLIIDHGIGMSPERLAEENARMARRERLDLVPTEVLGLFVTGRLARRHGFGVTLVPTPGGGITAVLAFTDQQLMTPAFPSAPSVPIPPTVPTPPALPAGHQPQAMASSPPGAEIAAVGPRGGSAMPPGLDSSAFDQVALDRATKAIAAGLSWDAFTANSGGVPALPAGPSSTQPPLSEASGRSWFEPSKGSTAPNGAPVNGSAPGAQPWTPPSALPPPTYPAPSARPTSPAPDVQPAAQQPAEPAPSAAAKPGLQRRIPGAQLPPGVAARRIEQTTVDADPAAARALVEEFEEGVRNAQRDTGAVPRLPSPRTATTGAPAGTPTGTATASGPAAPPTSQPPTSQEPAGTEPVASAVPPPPPSARPGLTRRVPGATLGQASSPANSTPATAAPTAGDADAARALIEQIESGVSRALNEVVEDDHRHEGLPR